MAGFWAHVDDDAFPWRWVCNRRKGGDSGLGVPADHAAKMPVAVAYTAENLEGEREIMLPPLQLEGDKCPT